MKASYLTKENKITVYTNPEYQGADIPDEYMNRAKDIDVPVTFLYGLEPDDKMRAKEHADTMLALALKMRKGWTPDPIIVVKTSKGYMILDGHHRWHAAKKAGVETLPAVVVDKGDLKYTDEIPEGRLAKAAGAAAIAGCIAGTPGCAVTSVKDVAKGVQTVGRTAQSVKDMGRAGAEEELYNILRQKLRNVKEGNVEETSIYDKLKQKLGAVSHKADYDKVASVLHSELVKASKGGTPQHGLGYYAQQLAKQFDGIDYRALIDVYKNTYGTEGLTESLDQPYELAPTSYLYSSGKWDVKAYSDTHVMIFRATRAAGETAGPGAHWTFEFGTKPIVSHGMYSMDKTGEGDSQRVFATAIAAIKEFVAEVEPGKVTFTAEKGDAGTSRTRLYQRLVKTYAPQLGFKASREAGDSEDTFTLVREAEMTKHEMGFGMHQYTNDSFALVGGARSGSSNPGEVRLRYDIYSWELADALGDPNKAKIGFTELRVSEEDGDILGLINIELDPEHRNKGYGRRVVKDIVDTTKTGKLDVHDIQADAKAFWQSFGGAMRKGATGDETTITRESASGYIPTAKEKNDPRFKTALTVDVKPGETQRQAKKLGMNIDKKGNPPLLHKTAAKNTSANKAYNLGLTESLMAKYRALKENRLDEEELVEISQTPGAIRDWASSEAAQDIIAGFEAEVIFADVGGLSYDDDVEPDYSEDRRPRSVDDVIEFFEFDEFGYGIYGREAEDLRIKLKEEYTEWVDEQIMNMWEYDEFRQVMEDEGWLDDLVQEELDDLEDNDELDDDEKAEEANERAEERMMKMWDGDSGFYSDALDVFRNLKYDDADLDEDEFFDQNYPFMSDISDNFGLSWPYIEGNAGDADAWDNLGMDLQDRLGKKVIVSTDYHGESRGDHYIIEPDSSISPDASSDAGVEIVSPPMPLAEAQQQFTDLMNWLKANNAYTNDSTGLHMGISLPDLGSDVDYIKMVLFTGDRYMLGEFERSYNSYARSAMGKLEDRVKNSKNKNYNFDKIDIVEIMKNLRSGLATIASKLMQGKVGQEKYTSIHVKPGYIEFRIAGGDYLNKVEQAELAMLRFARAYTIAGDPDKERGEYLKKLYKLADTENPIENMWADYQAGKIDAETLKDRWANQVLGIDPEAGKQDAFGDKTWHVRIKPSGEVVKDLYARDREEAEELFQNYLKNYPESMHKDYVLVDPSQATKDVEKAGRKGEVAQRLQQRERIFRFRVEKPDANLNRGIMDSIIREAEETVTIEVPAKNEESARKKLPYYADWITPMRAEQAKLVKQIAIKGDKPEEPVYKDKEFAFEFNVKEYGEPGPTQTIKVNAPNRPSAIEKLRGRVRKTYGVMARINDLKDVDPGKDADGDVAQQKQNSYPINVKIECPGSGTTFKRFDSVQAPSPAHAKKKVEDLIKQKNPGCIVSASISQDNAPANLPEWEVRARITGSVGVPVGFQTTVKASSEIEARSEALKKFEADEPGANIEITSIEKL